MVELHVANVVVVGSNPTTRSNNALVFQWLEYILGKDETGVRFSTGAPSFVLGVGGLATRYILSVDEQGSIP